MSSQPRPIAVSNPYFKAALIFVATASALCLVGQACLAIWANDPMTKAQESLSALCVHGFMTGLALFVGLAGGRAGQPDYAGQLPVVLPPSTGQTKV